MPTKELAEKYGKSANSRTLINRAIRAELVGGDYCLDALNALDQLRQKWKARGWAQSLADIETALEHTHRVYEYMRAEIRTRYGIPDEDTKQQI